MNEYHDQNNAIFHPSMYDYCKYTDIDVDYNISAFSNNDFLTELGLITFGTYTTVSLIGNKFYDNIDINSWNKNRNIAYIYINNGNSNCMSGNYYENYAIYMESYSSICSCHRPEIENILHYIMVNMACWNGTIGVINEQYSLYENGDIFRETNGNNKIPIIETAVHTYLALYNSSFDPGKYILFGNLLIIDSIQTSAEGFSVIRSSACNIHCSRYINNNIMSIAQLCMTCSNESIVIQPSFIHEIHSVSINHFSPYYIQFILLNNSDYFPGQKLSFLYILTDIYGNTISDFEGDVDVSVEENNLNFYAQIKIDSVSDINQIYLQSVDVDHFGYNYTLTLSVLTAELFPTNDIHIKVIQCPSGYGVSNSEILRQCEKCTNGYYNLLPTTESCIYCANYDNYNTFYSCDGTDSIIINYNHWIAVKQSNNAFIFPNDETIIGDICPSIMCCQSINGCSYIKDADKLCAQNRNTSVPLCGSCKQGFSECFQTSACCLCEENHIERILFPIVFGFIVAFAFVLLKSEDSQPDVKQSTSCISKVKDFNLDVIINKCIVYYYQSLSYIFINSGIRSPLIIFVNLFNLTLNYDIFSSDKDGICWYNGLSLKHKIFTPLYVTISSVLFLCVFRIVSMIFFNNHIICCIKRKIKFGQTSISLLLLCIGQILTVLFKYVSCKQISHTVTVQFYFGDIECYGALWMTSLVIFCIILLFICGLILILLKHKNNTMFEPLLFSFVHKCWYFEFIIMIKRVIVASLTIVYYSSNSLILLSLFLYIYFFIVSYFKPFKIKSINMVESILILLTLCIIMIEIAHGYNIGNELLAVLLIVSCILLPIIILFIYIVFMCCNDKGAMDSYQHPKKPVPENDDTDIDDFDYGLPDADGSHDMQQYTELQNIGTI